MTNNTPINVNQGNGIQARTRTRYDYDGAHVHDRQEIIDAVEFKVDRGSIAEELLAWSDCGEIVPSQHISPHRPTTDYQMIGENIPERGKIRPFGMSRFIKGLLNG